MDNNQLLKILEGIISIGIKDKEGNIKVIYEAKSTKLEGMNDKVRS